MDQHICSTIAVVRYLVWFHEVLSSFPCPSKLFFDFLLTIWTILKSSNYTEMKMSWDFEVFKLYRNENVMGDEVNS
jgi:hypothetical protein